MVTAALTDTIVLSHHLSHERVVFLDASSRESALEQMHALICEQGIIEADGAFLEALTRRERIVSTGIGMGVAIPHAKLPSIDDFFITIGIAKGGIEWDSLDCLPVRLIFMIGGPEGRQDDYLKILSALTTLIRDEDRRKKLIACCNRPHEIISLLSQ